MLHGEKKPSEIEIKIPSQDQDLVSVSDVYKAPRSYRA